ncbi:MAG: carbohydrate-binding module family 14 protein [Rhodobacter sp.]|nr:carbohydrate-binding module family 14 protein [Rhodobacter sp.]
MSIKTTLAAAILALAPTFAIAQGCHSDHGTEQAMSCSDGLVWDPATGACVEQVTS